jgi:hypothetical protein
LEENKMNTKTKSVVKQVQIVPLNIIEVVVKVEGETELIVNKFSEKAQRQIEEKQQGKAKRKKDVRVPEAEYEASMYRFEDGRHGFPSSAFKAAIVGACRHFDNIPMTLAKISLRVSPAPPDDNGELCVIEGEPYMRTDPVKLASGVLDLRYRAGYPNWSTSFKVVFNANSISLELLTNLIVAAGQFGGIGEWRQSAPKSSTGSFGCFNLDKIEVIERGDGHKK